MHYKICRRNGLLYKICGRNGSPAFFLQFANEKPEIIASSNQGNIGAGFSEDNMIERIYDSAT